MKTAKEMRTERMRELLAMKSDDLYALLAPPAKMARLPTTKSAIARLRRERARKGKKRFERIREALFKKACVDWDYCSRIGTFENSLVLASAVASVIPSIVGVLPATTVAAIVVKMGLGRFCGCRAAEKGRRARKRAQAIVEREA
jgi:hypothetical protein